MQSRHHSNSLTIFLHWSWAPLNVVAHCSVYIISDQSQYLGIIIYYSQILTLIASWPVDYSSNVGLTRLISSFIINARGVCPKLVNATGPRRQLELSRTHIPWLNLLWVWLIGVAKTKATIVALVATAIWFLAKPNLFFAIFNSLVAITACKSVWKFRSGRFCADSKDNDDDNRRTNWLLYSLHMRTMTTKL